MSFRCGRKRKYPPRPHPHQRQFSRYHFDTCSDCTTHPLVNERGDGDDTPETQETSETS